jgi:ubiquinone/menaquinone biosynthesis C-methylase UbiE
MSSTGQFFTDGAAYDQMMGRWSRRVGDVFIGWLGPPEKSRWLDIGCGTGTFTEQVAENCGPASVIGIDPSPEQLAFAEQRIITAEFQVGDAQALAYPDNTFDIAVMALTIHFIPDPGKAVSEMARVLRQGGLGAAYVWDYTKAGSPTAPLAAGMRAIGLDPPAPPSRNATSLAVLKELWTGAGFVQIDTCSISITVEFASFEEFWNSMTVPAGPAGKAVAEMPADSRARLRNTLEARLSPTGNGRIVYVAVANAIRGQKTSEVDRHR